MSAVHPGILEALGVPTEERIHEEDFFVDGMRKPSAPARERTRAIATRFFEARERVRRPEPTDRARVAMRTHYPPGPELERAARDFESGFALQEMVTEFYALRRELQAAHDELDRRLAPKRRRRS